MVDGAAHLEVTLKCSLGEGVRLVGADVEDELVCVEKVVHLVDHNQKVLAVRPDLGADLVVRERLFELVERGDKDLLHRASGTSCRGALQPEAPRRIWHELHVLV